MTKPSAAIGRLTNDIAEHLKHVLEMRGQAAVYEEHVINRPLFKSETDEDNPFADALDFKGGKGGGNDKGGGNGRNFDPETQAQSTTATESASVSIDLLAGAYDKNGDVLAVTQLNGQSISYNSWVSLPSGARVFLESSGTLIFDPSGAYDALQDGDKALETITYTVSDGRGGTSKSAVQIEIIGENNAPVIEPDAIDDMFIVDAGSATTLDVLINDLDLAGGGLEITAIDGLEVLPGEHVHLDSGAELIVGPDGTILYDATASDAFTDGTLQEEFTYTVKDTNGLEDTAQATVKLSESSDGSSTPIEPTLEAIPSHITALLAGDDYRLNAGEAYGSHATVTFAFADAPPDYYPSSSYVHDEFYAFTDRQREATHEILVEIENITGLSFVEVSVEEAEMVFGIANMAGDSLGTAFYPSVNGADTFASDVWIDSDIAGAVFEPGTLGYTTLIHEVGHALGLKHPDTTLLNWFETTRQFTVMGYGDHPTATADASSFMLYDIAALQHLYGADDQATSGDDVYQVDAEVRTIWDSGGRDALDASNSTSGAVLNLAEGTFSSTGGQTNNIAIGFESKIEEALGSAYDDTILGNEVDNWIDGGAGNDTLSGGDGADTYGFSGGWGQDTIEDYAVGEDRLDFSGSGLTLEDLLITAVDGDTLISGGENSLRLAGIDGEEDQLDETFMLF